MLGSAISRHQITGVSACRIIYRKLESCHANSKFTVLLRCMDVCPDFTIDRFERVNRSFETDLETEWEFAVSPNKGRVYPGQEGNNLAAAHTCARMP